MGDAASLAPAAVAVLVNVGAWLVAFGALRGTVATMKDDIEALQAEVKGINDLKVQFAGMQATLSGMMEQFKDLNASIRWMREPAAAYQPTMPGRGTER